MKVCILGGGITGLTLAKGLVNQGLYVDIFLNKKSNAQSKARTIGISKSNIDFFNENIININKFLWNIERIEILSDNLKNEKMLNFKNKNKTLFSLIKNKDLSKFLLENLSKNKNVKLKKNYQDFDKIRKKYKLIFNCDPYNLITKKIFYKRIEKNYNSYAHTAIIKHKKLSDNNVAIQIFTKKGPLAFLPISNNQTSIVYSLSSPKNEKSENITNLINKYNFKYKIEKIDEIKSFELKSISLRSYYYDNILAFGDLLHSIHPLAGQGFNMTIRDIKILIEIIKSRIELGLNIDKSVNSDFENQLKHKNFIFSYGVDFIHEFFNFERKFKNNFLSKSVQSLGKNNSINKIFKKIADQGIIN